MRTVTVHHSTWQTLDDVLPSAVSIRSITTTTIVVDIAITGGPAAVFTITGNFSGISGLSLSALSGTVTGVDLSLDGVAQFSASGLTVNVASAIEDGFTNVHDLIEIALDDDSLVDGSDDSDTLHGSPGSDDLSGNDGDDDLSADIGDDDLAGDAGDDRLDGGSGHDRAHYSGRRSDYDTERIDDTVHVDDSVSGRDGHDTLLNVERLEFADARVALDIDGAAGEAYRLYQAAFERTPDIGGLSNWIHSLDAGMSLAEAARAFLDSAEFRNAHGTLSNSEFVSLLYNNVLHRSADDGFANWVNELNAGVQTQAQVLAAFSESAENKSNVLPEIRDGITYDGSAGERTEGTASDDAVTGTVGLDTVHQHGNRADYLITHDATGVVVSDSVGGRDGADHLQHVERIEFSDGILALDTDGNAGDVYRLYQAAFNRTPDIPGLSNWVRTMDAGMSVDKLAQLFSESAEFTQRFGNSQTNTDFLTTLYDNVLHRAPDDAGLANWLNQLDAHALSRAQVLADFSDSLENHNNVDSLIANGVVLDLGV